MLWNWIRAQVKLAFLAGVHDAVVELDGGAGENPPDKLADLRGRLLALPAASAEKEPAANGKLKRER